MRDSFIVIFFFISSVIANAQTSEKVNTSSSSIKWVGKKIVGSHEGNVSLSAGTLFIKNGLLSGGNFTIDMNSITCTDIADNNMNGKLVGHLKNDDFFAVEKFPTSNLVIKKIAKQKGKSGKYTLTADLTIKGITQSISFPAILTRTNNKYKATATFNIDRTKWDIKYGSSSFFENLGDKAIKNEIEFVIIVETL